MISSVITFFTNDKNTASSILMGDYKKIRALFDEFYYTEIMRGKRQIIYELINIIKKHIFLKEETLYKAIDGKIDSEILLKLKKELFSIKILLLEIETLYGTEDYYDAILKVLSEDVLHHVREEELKILNNIKNLKIDLSELGRKMAAIKRLNNEIMLPVQNMGITLYNTNQPKYSNNNKFLKRKLKTSIHSKYSLNNTMISSQSNTA